MLHQKTISTLHRKRRDILCDVDGNLWPNRQECLEVLEDCTVIPTALHVVFPKEIVLSSHFFFFLFFVLCSAVFSFQYCNDMDCQQMTIQTVKA